MFSLTFATTYILYLWIPILAFWLSRRDSHKAHIASLILSGISLLLAFIGLVSLVSSLLDGVSLGTTPGLIAFSWILIIVCYGGYTFLSGYTALRAYLLVFRNS